MEHARPILAERECGSGGEEALSPHTETKAAAAEKGDTSGASAPLHRQNSTGLRSTTLLKRGNNSKVEYNHRTQQATPTMQTCKGIQEWLVAICIKAVVKHFVEQNSKTVE
uniref:Retrotransposon protein, putative, Ty3-gypsy subclass n=1 Tax=Oryza sativa subsp. japonica TaxID=39947 RepID=Q339G2_ORYSJ|nr:retrotransposon protein, putative, Ty3-gypsy subclass [Oryza sativa Japonica Group]